MRIVAFGGEEMSRVCLVLYARPNREDWERLRELVGEKVPDLGLEIYQKFSRPSEPSRETAEENPIAVLLEVDKKKLLDLMILEDPLWDVPAVLIVPRLDNTRVELARRVLPRFLIEDWEDRSEMARIIKKLNETTH